LIFFKQLIDFETFEELFKTGSGLPINQANVSPHFKQKFIKIPESLTLLDPQRQRNLGKMNKKQFPIYPKSRIIQKKCIGLLRYESEMYLSQSKHNSEEI